jgi:long-subunit fatty acid transport protein
MSFKGFNPNSTIAQWYAPDGWYDPNDPSYNLAYMLYLADTNATGQYVSPIKNRLTQLGTVIEGGGLNNWSAAGGFDLSKNFAVGVTLTYLSGSYRYDRSYREEDSQHLYSNLPLANYKSFQALAIDDYIDDDVSGWNAMLGLMYRVPDKFRFGMTIKTPTALTIHEKYGTTGHSYFNDGPVTEFTSDARNDYDITTPWVFGAGMSVILRDLILSADIDYTDWTTLEFTNASADLIAENKDIKTLFHGTANLRGGAEYEFTSIGLRLRGGFIYNPSPFRGDPGSFAQKVVTGGLGILLGESTMIDLAYARGWRDTFIYNYDATSRVDEKIATNTVLLTLTHRF